MRAALRSVIFAPQMPGWLLGGAAALRDVDLKSNRYWQGATKPAVTDLLSTARSSAHLLANASGIYQSFSNNVLARNDAIGAYVGGQVTNVLVDPNDLSSSAWQKQSSPTFSANGDFWTITDAQSGGNSQILQVISIAADTALRTTWVDVKKDSEGTIFRSILFQFYGSVSATRQIVLNTQSGAAAYSSYGSSGVSIRDLGDRWRVIWTYTNQNNTNFKLYLTPAWTNDFNNSSVSVPSLQSSASFGWPHLVSGNYPGDNFRVNGTRLASDVTAAGMTWFAPLDGIGATEIVVPKWSHTGDGVNRPLFDYVKDANNYIRGYVNASDKPALKIVSGGVTQTDTALTTAITTGRKPLVFGWSASGGYIGDAAGNVATFGAVTLPSAIVTDRWGSSQAGNYLNDILERRATLRNISQAQALALAAAA